MKTQTCILCGLPLSTEKTNLEHFIPQVLLRNAEKLKVPKTYTHALRIDRRGPISVSKIYPLERHREWATIEVHERCNLDASQMCQDLKRWIDAPNKWPTDEERDRICGYYAGLWGYKADQIGLCRIEPLNRFQITYERGELSFGWLGIRSTVLEDLARLPHRIFIGEKAALEDMIG